MPRFAYRQIHEQTGTAVAAMIVLAEFGLRTFDPAQRGQELTLHGLCQRGGFEPGRGILLRNALKHLGEAGLRWEIRHNAQRTQELDQMPRIAEDLGATGHRPLNTRTDFGDDARVLLTEARPSNAHLVLHILLVRQEGQLYYLMNPDTGQDTAYTRWQLEAHLNSPAAAGPTAIGGRLYLHTGIAARIWK